MRLILLIAAVVLALLAAVSSASDATNLNETMLLALAFACYAAADLAGEHLR